MPTSSSPSLTCTNINLFKPCKKFLIKLFKKPISIKPFRFPTLRNLARKMRPNRSRRSRFRSVRAVFWPLVSSMRSAEAIDRVGELPSLADRVRAPLPSPVTPAYVKIAQLRREESVERRDDDDAEEACRSFESYLMEMIVEEGRVRDLMDVEELLYCWESLKCPAFVELVCRFYGELCKDLFSNNEGGVVEEPVST